MVTSIEPQDYSVSALRTETCAGMSTLSPCAENMVLPLNVRYRTILGEESNKFSGLPGRTRYLRLRGHIQNGAEGTETSPP